MTSDQFISVRETAQLLRISEKKVMDMVTEGKLRAYRIADQFLRLKKTEVISMHKAGEVKAENFQFSYSAGEKIKDFFYFNDFYLFSILIIAGLLYLILHLS